jgi:hypothetical protein
MGRLNITAAALFIIWIVEFFGYNAGEDIHILLLLSIIIMLAKTFILIPMKEYTATKALDNLTVTGDWAKQSKTLKETFTSLTDADLNFVIGKENDLLSRLQSRLGKKRNDVIELLRVGHVPTTI